MKESRLERLLRDALESAIFESADYPRDDETDTETVQHR